MAQGSCPGEVQIEDCPAYVEKTAVQLQLLRLLVLYVVNSFTGTALTVIKTLGIDKLLQNALPFLQTGLAVLVRITSFGRNRKRVGRDVCTDGKHKRFMVYSVINVTDDTFSPHSYLPKEFPFAENALTFGLLDGIHEWRAHFLSLCVKAAYEEPLLFQNITTTDWSPFRYVDTLRTEDKEHCGHECHLVNETRFQQLVNRCDRGDRKRAVEKAKVLDTFIPQTRAHIITNEHAVILVFRGTEPTNLIQWATDASCEMTTKPEVVGKVHEGFYEALFYKSTESDDKKVNMAPHALFQCICEALDDEVGHKKSLYVTGHSLGGALVSVFAHCLAKLALDDNIPDWPAGPRIVKKLMARVMNGGGIYTFAGPLVGDDTFRDFSQTKFGCNLFRIVHAGDWVPQVPPYGLGYRHHTREYYLTTFGDMCADPDDIEHWRRIETAPLSFFALYIWKMVVGLRYRNESPVRTLERLLLLFIAPGLSDHWPSDYEYCLRKFCRLRSDRAQPDLPKPEEDHAALAKNGREEINVHGPGHAILKTHIMPKHKLVFQTSEE
ncbi:hypothetical protein WJX74_004532 [Apatococcus lobatus]|uniref:Fungal lipase-type domain-containing protein n=2 Tax=Apatococcus TaxID=904362 RepID=A0AAW1TAW9_9CHLO